MNRFSICVALVMFLSVLVFSQDNKAVAAPQSGSSETSTVPAHSTTNGPWFAQRHPRYQIRPGDVFDVVFEYTPEFNQTVTVQPDGYVSLRNAGDIYVVGETVPEATNTLTTAYSKLLNHPMISILLKDFVKPYFIADGQVGHPGKYELREDTTVVEAIAQAGGFLSSAKHSQVVLYRRVSDQWSHAQLLDIKKMQDGHDLSEDVHLQPGDMLYVPKNRLSKMMPFIPTSSLGIVPRTP